MIIDKLLQLRAGITDSNRQQSILVDYRCCTKLYVKRRAIFDDAPNLEFVAVDGINLSTQQARDRIIPSGCFYYDCFRKIGLRKIDVRAVCNYPDTAMVSLQCGGWWPPICFPRNRRTIK